MRGESHTTPTNEAFGADFPHCFVDIFEVLGDRRNPLHGTTVSLSVVVVVVVIIR